MHNYAQQTDSRIESSPFNYSNGRLPAPGNHSRLAGPPPPGYPLDPYYSICRRLATAPSIFPSGDFAGTPFPPFNPFRWNRTAPVDDQLPPRRSPQRRFIVPPVLRQFFHIFFCYPIGITFRSRSLVVFFQLRSVSCAPFTPAFADGVVQRSLALYLPCFVSLSPWMAESHLTPIIRLLSPAASPQSQLVRFWVQTRVFTRTRATRFRQSPQVNP